MISDNGQIPDGLDANTVYYAITTGSGISTNINIKLGKTLKKMQDEIVTDWRKEELGTRRELVLERIWRDAQDGDMKKIQLLAWLGCLDDE